MKEENILKIMIMVFRNLLALPFLFIATITLTIAYLVGSKTAPKTKKDQEKLIKALDIVAEMLEPKNCYECYPVSTLTTK